MYLTGAGVVLGLVLVGGVRDPEAGDFVIFNIAVLCPNTCFVRRKGM